MRSIRQIGRACLLTLCGVAVTVAGTLIMMAPAHAAFELPEGERITHLSVVPPSIPQKEEYELYDPKIRKNFDLKNFWIRAGLRVRLIWVRAAYMLVRKFAGFQGLSVSGIVLKRIQ